MKKVQKKSVAEKKTEKRRALREKFAELHARIKSILKRHPDVYGHSFTNLSGKKLILHICYPYNEDMHGERSFSVDSEEPKLSPVKVSEINLLGTIASEAAEGDFDVVFIPNSVTDDGEFEYNFVPRK